MMNKEDEINQLVSFLHEIEQDRELSREEKQTVMIEGAINLKDMCDHVVTCSRGDIVLIISMLHDYVKMLDEMRNTIQWEAYYRGKFLNLADRLSKQIHYDYEAAVKKCQKNQEREAKESDIGSDGVSLTAGWKGRKKKEEKKGRIPGTGQTSERDKDEKHVNEGG